MRCITGAPISRYSGAETLSAVLPLQAVVDGMPCRVQPLASALLLPLPSPASLPAPVPVPVPLQGIRYEYEFPAFCIDPTGAADGIRCLVLRSAATSTPAINAIINMPMSQPLPSM